MKPCLSAIILGLSLGGCATTPTARSVAGFYASEPVREDPGHYQWADGRSRIVTRDLTLTLNPDGRFTTWFREYFDGELVRFSVLAVYDLQTNSRGTWRLDRGRLRLHSVGPADAATDMVLRESGHAIAAEDSEAVLMRHDGRWVIRWQGTEYRFRTDAPGEPAAGVRPAAPRAAPSSP